MRAIGIPASPSKWYGAFRTAALTSIVLFGFFRVSHRASKLATMIPELMEISEISASRIDEMLSINSSFREDSHFDDRL